MAEVILSYSEEVMLSRKLLSVCRRRKERIIMIKREKKKKSLSVFSFPWLSVLCRAEISGRRAELCSSVLAPVRNPGRQKHRECRRRGSRIHLVWKTLLVRHFQRKLSYALLSFEIMCPIKFELRRAPSHDGTASVTLWCFNMHWGIGASNSTGLARFQSPLVFPVAFCSACVRVCVCVCECLRRREKRKEEWSVRSVRNCW